MTPDTNSLDGETAVLLSSDGMPFEKAGSADPESQASAAAAQDTVHDDAARDELATEIASRLDDMAGSLRQLADAAQRYHARAEQREAVIDQFSSEVERLRRGERRGMLRPLLVEACRLRADLLRQAEDLPADFDAERARSLLRSYADTVELMLADNGVTPQSPGEGDGFDPRMHRQAGTAPAPDPSAVGTIASVRRNGYLDVDSGTPVAPAEVVVFVRVPPANQSTGGHEDPNPDEYERNDQ